MAGVKNSKTVFEIVNQLVCFSLKSQSAKIGYLSLLKVEVDISRYVWFKATFSELLELV